jgi:hypothetical protein
VRDVSRDLRDTITAVAVIEAMLTEGGLLDDADVAGVLYRLWEIQEIAAGMCSGGDI